MYDEYDEINRFLDDEAEKYISTEEKLAERGIDFETAVSAAEKFRSKFFDLLDKKGICKDNICQICFDISELLKNDRDENMIFLYTALLTESGLLFGELEDDEQKVSQWLDQAEEMNILKYLIDEEQKNYNEVSEIIKNIKLSESTEIDSDEQEEIYVSVCQNTFLYNDRKNPVFYENIGELVRQVNANEGLKKIKPYVYTAILSRKHKKMTEQKGYIPNFKSIFKRKEYKIQKDNGKNFDTYQSYLELFAQMKSGYEEELNVYLSDYCLVKFSNLSEWFYDNCVPDESIPISFKNMIDISANFIFLPFEVEEIDISDFSEKNPKLEQAYDNLLIDDEQWEDFVKAMRNGESVSGFDKKLYEAANAEMLCSDKEGALKLAQNCLINYMEVLNRNILVDAADNFILSF